MPQVTLLALDSVGVLLLLIVVGLPLVVIVPETRLQGESLGHQLLQWQLLHPAHEVASQLSRAQSVNILLFDHKFTHYRKCLCRQGNKPFVEGSKRSLELQLLQLDGGRGALPLKMLH